ncbi:hypothetical protein RUND412_010332 [Rhizina undulata]
MSNNQAGDIEKELLKQFKEKDSHQCMYTRSWLDTLASDQKKNNGDLKTFSQWYAAVPVVLFKKGLLSEFNCDRTYLLALPDKTIDKVMRKLKIDPEDPEMMKFNPIKEKVLAQYKTEEWKKKLLSTGFSMMSAPPPRTNNSYSTQAVISNRVLEVPSSINEFMKQLMALTLQIHAI